MSRYIDANLISYEQRDRLGLGVDYGTTDKSTYEVAYKSQIDKIPTADVEEVRHGYWIPIESTPEYECSVCGRTITSNQGSVYVLMRYPYCHCGAKMDGGSR